MEVDQSDVNDIKKCPEETIYIWEFIRTKSGELIEIIIDIDNIKYNINDKNPLEKLETICRKMVIEKKLLNPIKKS